MMNAQQSARLAELTKGREIANRSKATARRWNLSNEAMEYAELTALAQQEARAATPKPQPRDWRSDPMTPAQKALLERFGIALEPCMTKGRASDLIEAHKNEGSVGHIGGYYVDGSN